MQTRTVLNHSFHIKKAIKALPVRFGLAFGAACCQRVLPVFVANETVADVDVAGGFLEKLWRSLSDLDDAPGDWSEVFEQCLPRGEAAEDDQEAYQSAVLFYGLAGYVFENRSTEIWRLSDGCLALLDSYLYRKLGLPVNGENDRIIDDHPLMRQAMKREEEDLELLGSLEIKSIFTIWTRSRQQQLLSL